jgi:hypothetical protein
MKTQTLKKRNDVKMDDNRDDNFKNSLHPFLSIVVSPKCNSFKYHGWKFVHGSSNLARALSSISGATVNQHPPVHHPLDAHYYSVVDELQLS